MTDTLSRDFLERQRLGDSVSEFPPLTEQNNLLRAILLELQKTHPSQRCVIVPEFTQASKTLTSNADRARIAFMNQGLPVKSLNTIIANNTVAPIYFAINDPVIVGAVGTNGIALAAGASILLPMEILNLELALSVAGPVIVSVNNSVPLGVAVNGSIQVYGWTIPAESSY